MGSGVRRLAGAVSVVLALTAATAARGLAAADPETLRRGAYLLAAGGCVGCHTDKKNKGPRLAGGRALKTPFGIFYSPNITPHPEHGIGAWSDADFLRALRHGRAPDGSHYFPVFPYPAYTAMTDDDILALKAYLFSQPPDARANRPHEARAPFGWRFLVGFWKWLYFEPGPFRPDPGRDARWNRGAYLVKALGHCGECHTPRDALGGFEAGMTLAGTANGPEGDAVPNITPDPQTGIGRWSDGELADLLSTGMLPDGDFVGAGMGEVVDNTTGRWTTGDRDAVIAYLRSLPPVRNVVAVKKAPAEKKSDW